MLKSIIETKLIRINKGEKFAEVLSWPYQEKNFFKYFCYLYVYQVT